MSTYHSQPGERVRISLDAQRAALAAGTVREFFPATGLPDASGIRADRVRVKLDAWPRPLIFLARYVAPV